RLPAVNFRLLGLGVGCIEIDGMTVRVRWRASPKLRARRRSRKEEDGKKPSGRGCDMAVTAFAKHAGGAILPERTGRRPLAAAGDERARGRPRGGRDGPVHPEHERDNDLMESYSERPRQVAGGAVPPDHQLPSGANKLERIAQHSKGLVDDLTAWVDLKVKLVQLDVERKVQEKATAAVVK